MVVMRMSLKIKEIKLLLQGCKNDRMECRGKYLFSNHEHIPQKVPFRN